MNDEWTWRCPGDCYLTHLSFSCNYHLVRVKNRLLKCCEFMDLSVMIYTLVACSTVHKDMDITCNKAPQLDPEQGQCSYVAYALTIRPPVCSVGKDSRISSKHTESRNRWCGRRARPCRAALKALIEICSKRQLPVERALIWKNTHRQPALVSVLLMWQSLKPSPQMQSRNQGQ